MLVNKELNVNARGGSVTLLIRDSGGDPGSHVRTRFQQHTPEGGRTTWNAGTEGVGPFVVSSCQEKTRSEGKWIVFFCRLSWGGIGGWGAKTVNSDPNAVRDRFIFFKGF